MAAIDEAARSFGGSLPVENVQHLAANNQLRVPDRYVRPELEHDLISDDRWQEIPVIDLGRLLDSRFSQEEKSKLHDACQNWGFFQLVNHGVSGELIEEMKGVVEEFFELPLSEKKVYAQPVDSIEGYGQAFVVSDDQKLDWGDMFFLVPQPLPIRNMKLWPTNPPRFRETLEKYSEELKRVQLCLLGLISANLGINSNKLIDMFKEGVQGVRMNYYPPCPEPGKVLGLSPHSDGTGLTLLLQANQVQGLQIRKNGQWVSVRPLAGAFVVNIGDILEILSNGRYKSIEHRAVIDGEKERISIAGFHNPNRGVTIGPMEEMVIDGELYKSINLEDFVRLGVSSKLDGKNLLEMMKLEINH
ncbi:hypothetical protein H6P81_005140 [Aristolochia fimbriata]|uniref:Fe2OG dioxygenase domain-containing protein n=1 Tax=Aristolochia fimbriata TaxID=158543 RepID=A0AAV7EX58_ARIFI|nr:hypothetical protein H6P81_005140 [Aristolochia fimbriata]